MNQVDQTKLIVIIDDTLQQLGLLGLIQPQNDVSSELAGHEISKLLDQQQKLESDYADLVQTREKLTDIGQRQELIIIQERIRRLAMELKESTGRFCKLFKENPNLDNDTKKINLERVQISEMLQDLINLIQSGQLNRFHQKTTQELETQDLLRKLVAEEKELSLKIRTLQQKRQAEYKDYQKMSEELSQKAQKLKERLQYKQKRAALKKANQEKEIQAREEAEKRLKGLQQNELLESISNLEKRIQRENIIHEELKEYLTKKEESVKIEADEWNAKTERMREQLDEEINVLTAARDHALTELEELRDRNQREQEAQKEREASEKKEKEDQQNAEYALIRLDNALRLIQQSYLDFKESGGKKKKKAKPKKK